MGFNFTAILIRPPSFQTKHPTLFETKFGIRMADWHTSFSQPGKPRCSNSIYFLHLQGAEGYIPNDAYVIDALQQYSKMYPNGMKPEQLVEIEDVRTDISDYVIASNPRQCALLIRLLVLAVRLP